MTGADTHARTDRAGGPAGTGTGGYVAVVCVTHDSARLLPGFAGSLPDRAGRYPVEVHVVDSGSTDGTVPELRRLRPDAEVHVMTGNRGFAAGINVAVAALARREHPPHAVVIVNPDTRFGERTAEFLVAELDADAGVGVAAPRLLDADGGLQLSLRRRPSPVATWAEAICGGPLAHRLGLPTEVVRGRDAYDVASDVGWATGGFLAVSWACLSAVGAWDESYFLYEEEVDFCLRAADAGFSVRYTPAAVGVRLLDGRPTAPWVQALMRANRVRHVRERDGSAAATLVRAGLLAGDTVRCLAGRPEARAGLWALASRAGTGRILRRYRPDARAVLAGAEVTSVPRARPVRADAAVPVPRPRSEHPGGRVDDDGARGAGPHVLVIVENLSVPFDRRVWQQSAALVRDGYAVTVICPMGTGRDTEPDVTIDGVRILRYPLRPARGGPAGYLREYAVALWHSARLARAAHRARRVDAVHACNPPDLLLLVGLPLKLLSGATLVFDHHDLVPELFESRFGARGGPFYRLAVFLERATFAVADGVISTNESYRAVALTRGGQRADRVRVVRSAPDLARFDRAEPDHTLRRGRRHLVTYLGVMGPQDGVDFALRAIAHLRDGLGCADVHVVMMGGGDSFDDMVRLRDELGLRDTVEFTGRVSDEFVRTCLSTADVCLAPDPSNPLNDVSTMNKIVEYMAMSRPIVSFDLKEARVSAGDAAAYAVPNDERDFARLVLELLGDEPRRRRMGQIGRHRIEADLSWARSEQALLEFYRSVVPGR